MGTLTKNFDVTEFTRSHTAQKKGIKNIPTVEHLTNLKKLSENVLEKVRTKFNKPVTITSGYRSPALNRAVGGSSSSQHAKGMAADFEIKGVSNLEVALWIKDNLVFDQLILEDYYKGDVNSGWIHVSYDTTRVQRKMIGRKPVGRSIVWGRLK